MNAIKQFPRKQITLVLVEGITYNNKIADLLRKTTGTRICYVALNKTCNAMRELHKEEALTKKFMYIDAISQTIGEKKQKEQKGSMKECSDCYYASSPVALTELSIIITKTLEQGIDLLIIDSLTNFLIYEKKEQVLRFIIKIILEAQKNNAYVLLYAISIREYETFIKECSVLVDEVIKI